MFIFGEPIIKRGRCWQRLARVIGAQVLVPHNPSSIPDATFSQSMGHNCNLQPLLVPMLTYRPAQKLLLLAHFDSLLRSGK